MYLRLFCTAKVLDVRHKSRETELVTTRKIYGHTNGYSPLPCKET